jgi:hypothetical protein
MQDNYTKKIKEQSHWLCLILLAGFPNRHSGSHLVIGRLSLPLGFYSLCLLSLSLSAAAFPTVRFDFPRRGVSKPSVLCRCCLVVVRVGFTEPAFHFPHRSLCWRRTRLVGPGWGGGHPAPHLCTAGIPGLGYPQPIHRQGSRRYLPPLSPPYRCGVTVVVVVGSVAAFLLILACSSSLLAPPSCCTPPPPPPLPLHAAPLLLFTPSSSPCSSSCCTDPPPLRHSLLLLLLFVIDHRRHCRLVSSLSIGVIAVNFRRRGPKWWWLSLESMKKPAHILLERGGARAAASSLLREPMHCLLSPHPSKEGRGSRPGRWVWLGAKCGGEGECGGGRKEGG